MILTCYSMKLKIILLFFIIVSAIRILGQSESDSLKSVIVNTSGIAKLIAYSTLLDLTLYDDLDSACENALQFKAEAQKQNNKKYLSLAYRGIAIIRFYKYQYKWAELAINNAIILQKEINDTSNLANSYKILTSIYWETERYEKSVSISFKALNIYEAIGDTLGIISANNNIGLLYSYMQDYKEAKNHYEKALKFLENNKINYPIGNLYNNIGLVYKNTKVYDSALLYYNLANSAYKKQHSSSGMASVFLNIGNIYAFHVLNSDSAFYCFNKALELSENSNFAVQTDIYSSIGGLYEELGDYKNSITAYKNELSLATKNNDNESVGDANSSLADVYKKSGDIENAYKHLKYFIVAKDSLNMEKAKVAIANLESKYENDKNLHRIEDLKQKQKTDKTIIYLSILGFILIIFVLALTVRVYAYRRKSHLLTKKLLEAKNEKLEEDVKYKTRQLTSRTLMMVQKNTILNEILKFISEINTDSAETNKNLASLKWKLKQSIHSEEDWNLFHHYFEELNKDFYTGLTELNPKLSSSELKLCALIKLNLSIKETASVLNITPNSVKSTRYVLRKKLGLKKGDNLYKFLREF